MASANNHTCRALNKQGEPCRARAVERGLCVVHAGIVDPSEIGRRGGLKRPNTRLRKAADDSLREKARRVLERALAGEEVDREQLAAAKSLFSYRADSPPTNEQGGQQGPPMVVGFLDLVLVGAESRMLSSAGVMSASAERQLFLALTVRQESSEAIGEKARAAFAPPPPPGKEDQG